MAGDLTPQAEKTIDLKLERLKNEMKSEMIEENKESNKLIREIHQVLCGYDAQKGVLGKQEEYAIRLDNHEKRIEAVEINNIGKIETKKAIAAVLVSIFGAGGIATVISLFILNVLGA